ncbi:uncharacterized protein LOC123523904 [Mercenaria mercenaria]|uniref:uncharacterized protein LOC123523904 n=1 Tax=Mercenaria mercenaria TaxID=6596 RepID=UPI001E1E169E|nr:uncharacterized protein LOC123523904 [Mercenaria mercenaria]
MAAEKLMLQGRYFSKMRKYGMIGGAITLVSGAVTYVYVKQRQTAMEDYFKSLTPEKVKATSDRCFRFGGYTRDEKYPNIPRLDNSDGKFDGFLNKFSGVDTWLQLEVKALGSFDPQLPEYFSKLFLAGIREDFFESESQRTEFQNKLENARQKLRAWSKGKSMDHLSEADKVKMMVFNQLEKQTEEGFQVDPVPLAQKYLPKTPSE